MDKRSSEYSASGKAQKRLAGLLERLAIRGFSQNEAAAKAGLPPQYLSDIKCGRRSMTELVARRLGEVFDVNYEWLTGEADSPSVVAAVGSMGSSSQAWLPLFSYPIQGDPRSHPKWDGTGIEIAGPAVAKLALAELPYVLKFGRADVDRRLQHGDLILISQAVNPRAEISIVRNGRGSYLARRNPDGSWRRTAPKEADLPATCLEIGHCVGIVWSSL